MKLKLKNRILIYKILGCLLVLIIFISFYIANKNIDLLIKKDLETIGLSIDNLISIFEENDSKAWENNKFKEAIKKIKIGKKFQYLLLLAVRQMNIFGYSYLRRLYEKNTHC